MQQLTFTCFFLVGRWTGDDHRSYYRTTCGWTKWTKRGVGKYGIGSVAIAVRYLLTIFLHSPVDPSNR